NTITAGQDDLGGVWANLDYAPSATLNITSNTINAGAAVTGLSGHTFGIYLTSLQNGFNANLTGNIVGASGGQFAAAISLWNLPTSTPVIISGGSIGNSLIGILATNDDINFGAAAANTVISVSGVSISGADNAGILVHGDNGDGSESATI